MTKKDRQKVATELRSIAQLLEKKAAVPTLEDVASIDQLKGVLEKSDPSAWRRLEQDFASAVTKLQEESMGEILE